MPAATHPGSLWATRRLKSFPFFAPAKLEETRGPAQLLAGIAVEPLTHTGTIKMGQMVPQIVFKDLPLGDECRAGDTLYCGSFLISRSALFQYLNTGENPKVCRRLSPKTTVVYTGKART